MGSDHFTRFSKLGLQNRLYSRVLFWCKGKGIYQSSHLGYDKFLQIEKLTYSTYLNLINFCLELIPKLQPIQICTFKFCYHKLWKFNLSIPVYNHILIFILLFHLQLHFLNLQLFVQSSFEPLLLNLIFFSSNFCFCFSIVSVSQITPDTFLFSCHINPFAKGFILNIAIDHFLLHFILRISYSF